MHIASKEPFPKFMCDSKVDGQVRTNPGWFCRGRVDMKYNRYIAIDLPYVSAIPQDSTDGQKYYKN